MLSDALPEELKPKKRDVSKLSPDQLVAEAVGGLGVKQENRSKKVQVNEETARKIESKKAHQSSLEGALGIVKSMIIISNEYVTLSARDNRRWEIDNQFRRYEEQLRKEILTYHIEDNCKTFYYLKGPDLKRDIEDKIKTTIKELEELEKQSN